MIATPPVASSVPDSVLGSVFALKHHAAASCSVGAGLRSQFYRRYPWVTLWAPSPAPLVSVLPLRMVRAGNRKDTVDLSMRERGRLHVSAGGCGGACARMCAAAYARPRGVRVADARCDLW